MFDFIKSAYRVFVLIGFWVFLIGCTIGGGIIGNSIGRSYDYWSERSSGGGHPILGGFIGLIVGFVIDVLVFGFIATVLNIDDNLEQLKYNFKNGSSSSSGSSSLNLGDVSPLASIRRQEEKTKATKKCLTCLKRTDFDNTRCPFCGGTNFD